MNLQFTPARKVVTKDTTHVKSCSIYWCAFPDLNPNSYDNLNSMKLDLILNVFTKPRKVKFSANKQGL